MDRHRWRSRCMIAGFYAVHRHYAGRVPAAPATGTVAVDGAPRRTRRGRGVEELNAATRRGHRLRAVVPPGTTSAPCTCAGGATHADLAAGGTRSAGPSVAAARSSRREAAASAALLELPPRRSPASRSDFVTVVVPELLTKRSLLAAVRRRRASFLLKLRLLVRAAGRGRRRAGLSQDPDATQPGRPRAADPRSGPRRWCSSPPSTTATIRAINYARSLRATETRAMFVALDPDEVERHHQGTGRSAASRWSWTSWRRPSASWKSPSSRRCAA